MSSSSSSASLAPRMPLVLSPANGSCDVERVMAIATRHGLVIHWPPGSLTVVPMRRLEALRQVQGIPTTGGHMIVRTGADEYQIIHASPDATAGMFAATTLSTGSQPVQTAPPMFANVWPTFFVMQPWNMAQSNAFRVAQPAAHEVPARAAGDGTGGADEADAVGGEDGAADVTGATGGRSDAHAASGAASSDRGAAVPGAGNRLHYQLTPDVAKVNCRNFLASLLRLVSESSPSVSTATSVRILVRSMVGGTLSPEYFCSTLPVFLNSPPQPYLLPFLKYSLPHLQDALRTGELSLEDMRPPPLFASTVTPASDVLLQ